MPKSKARKSHKKKLEARRISIKNETTKAQKFQREFIENLIKQEQEKGLFNNNPYLGSFNEEPVKIEGPIL
jgi:hypothetical protein